METIGSYLAFLFPNVNTNKNIELPEETDSLATEDLVSNHPKALSEALTNVKNFEDLWSGACDDQTAVLKNDEDLKCSHKTEDVSVDSLTNAASLLFPLVLQQAPVTRNLNINSVLDVVPTHDVKGIKDIINGANAANDTNTAKTTYSDAPVEQTDLQNFLSTPLHEQNPIFLADVKLPQKDVLHLYAENKNFVNTISLWKQEVTQIEMPSHAALPLQKNIQINEDYGLTKYPLYATNHNFVKNQPTTKVIQPDLFEQPISLEQPISSDNTISSYHTISSDIILNNDNFTERKEEVRKIDFPIKNENNNFIYDIQEKDFLQKQDSKLPLKTENLNVLKQIDFKIDSPLIKIKQIASLKNGGEYEIDDSENILDKIVADKSIANKSIADKSTVDKSDIIYSVDDVVSIELDANTEPQAHKKHLPLNENIVATINNVDFKKEEAVLFEKENIKDVTNIITNKIINKVTDLREQHMVGSTQIEISTTALGRIAIDIHLNNKDQLFIKITAHKNDIKQELEEKVELLKSSLKSLSVSLADFQVSVDPSRAVSDFFDIKKQALPQNQNENSFASSNAFFSNGQNFQNQSQERGLNKNDDDLSIINKNNKIFPTKNKSDENKSYDNVYGHKFVQRSANGSIKVTA